MFDFYYNFSETFFSSISQYSANFVEFMFTPIEIVGVATWSPFELVFSSTLFAIITYGIIKFILDIWPG